MFGEGVDVACGDVNGLAPAVNELLEIGTASAVFEGTAWIGVELDVCAVDEVTVWLNRDDGDGDGDGVRCLKGRCASIRRRRLTFTDGMGLPLISTNIW